MAVGDITLTTPAEVASASGYNIANVSTCALSANRVAQLYGNSSGQGMLRVGTVGSDNVITWGTAVAAVSSNFPVTTPDRWAMCSSNEKTVVIVYSNASTNKGYVVAVPITGTTVGTSGTAVQIDSTTTNYITAEVTIKQAALNMVLISFTQGVAGGVGNYVSIRLGNIVGVAISLTAVRNIVGVLANYSTTPVKIAFVGYTRAVVLFYASAGSVTGLCTQIFSFSEASISAITIAPKQVFSGYSSHFNITNIDSTRVAISYTDIDNTDVKAISATIANDGTLTKGTAISLGNGTTANTVMSMSNDVFYALWQGPTGSVYLNYKRCTLSGTAITAGDTQTGTEISSGISTVRISEYKALICYGATATKIPKYIIANEEKPDWAIETYPTTNAFPTTEKVTHWKTVAIDDSKFIEVYSSTVGKIAYAIVGTKDANGDITYGTPFNCSSQLSFPTITSMSAVVLDSTHFVVALYSATSAWCKYATISGTTITAGTAYAFKAAASQLINLEKISDTSFLVSFISTTPISRIGTINAGVISYGDEYSAPRTGTISNLAVKSLTSSSFVFTYKDSGLAATQRIMLANISGGVVSYEGNTNILPDYNTLDYIDILRLDDTSFVLSYRNTTSTQYVHVRKCTVSGTTITLGTAYSANGSGVGFFTSLGYIDSTHIVISYRDLTTNANNAVIGTLNDYEITFGTTYIDYLVPFVNNTNIIIGFDGTSFLRSNVDIINTQINAKLLTVNTPVYSVSYSGTGTITLSASFTYSKEDASKSYNADGTITLTASFDKEIDRETSISGTVNLSSSFDYEWQASQLDVVEIANGTITLSSAFSKAFSIDRNANGAINLSSAFTKAFDITREISGSINISGDFDTSMNIDRNVYGNITVSGLFNYSEINEYSFIINGLINTSSSFTCYQEIDREVNGLITLSSNFNSLFSIDRNANGIIQSSSSQDYYQEINRVVDGNIDLTSSFEYLFTPVIASYNANGLISSTSNFVYERDGKVKISDDYIFKDSSVYEGDIEWLTDTKFIIAYKGSNGYGYSKVGDVSGDTISYGEEYSFSGEVIDYFSVAILSSSSFVIAWNKGVNIYTLKYIVSGNVITHPIGVGTLINYANIVSLHVVYSGNSGSDAVILNYNNKSRVIYLSSTSATEYSETTITTNTTYIPQVTKHLDESIICTYIYNNNPYIKVGVRGNQTCTYSFETKLSNIIINNITNCIMLSDTKLLVIFTTSTKTYGVTVRMNGSIPVAVGDAIEFDSYPYLSKVSSLTSSYFLYTYNNKARVCSFSDISYSNTNISFGQSYDIGVLFTDLKSRNSTSLGFKEGTSPSIYLLTQDLHVFDQHSNANGLINLTSDFDIQIELSSYTYEGSGSIIIDSYSICFEDYEGLFIKQIYGDIIISSNTETFRDPIITEANGLISLSSDMQTFVNPIQTSANGVLHLSSDNKVLYSPAAEIISNGIISSLNQYNLGSSALDLQVCMLNETHGFVTNGSYARGFKYIYPNITWYGAWQQIYNGTMGLIEYEVIDTWSDRAGNGKIVISKTGTNWDISQINVVATSSNVSFYSSTTIPETSGSTMVYSVDDDITLWHSGTNTLNLNIAGNNTIVQTSEYSRGRACYITSNRILVVYTDYTKTYYKVYSTSGEQLSSGTLLNNIGGVEIDLKPFLNGEAIFATKGYCYKLVLIGDDISIASTTSLGSYVYQPKIAILNSYSGWVVVWNQDNTYENRQYIFKNGNKGPLYQTQIISTCIAADSGNYTNFVTATENSDGINLKFYGMDAFYNKITPIEVGIRLSSAFAYRYYPDFFPTVDGITIYTSSDIIPVLGVDRDINGLITASSNIIPEVGFEYDANGLITLTSDFNYEEDNYYSYIINGDIILSSDFIYAEGNEYSYNADGVITLSSIEETYPEILRDVSGEITLTSDFAYEEDNFYSYDGTGIINLSSSFTTENNYDYLTDANGVIIVISNTYYEANSFEYVLLGNISLSSDFTVSNYYEYITQVIGLISSSSIQQAQIDYDRTINGVITLSSVENTYPEILRDANGDINLSSDFDYELYSRDYLYDANGVIALTSDFDYEEYNDYSYTGLGTILVTGYFPEEVTTYKYHIEGVIQISSSTTHEWLADSKEVMRVESLISKTIRTESILYRKIIVRGLVSKNNKLNARL